MADLVVSSLVVSMALVWGVGAVLFGIAFRELGSFELNLPFVLKWFLNPIILSAVLVGVLARVLFYVGISYYSVSQLTLFSALGIVTALFLGRVFLGDQLTLKEWLGAALVVVGTAFIGD